MSFQDIETGQVPTRTFNSPPSHTGKDPAFLALHRSLSTQVLTINANVQGIRKRLNTLGTGDDFPSVRKELHDLIEVTRAMVKRGSEDLKKLSAMQSQPQDTLVQKISQDFQTSFVAFHEAQKASAERQRTVVQAVRMAVEQPPGTTFPPEPASPARQLQLFQPQISPHELAYQESLIQEREAEIHEIETGIHELSEIFRELGTLVSQQGSMIDNIETNIYSTTTDTQGAAQELTIASESQRKAGRRAFCLMIIIAFVVVVVLLAVLSP